MIIVVSDVHLGYDKSDQDNFSNFIDSDLKKLGYNDQLVLLGDIFDFWRKNCIDVTVEYSLVNKKGIAKSIDNEGIILKKIFDLSKQTNIFYIVGNHDYSMLHYYKRAPDFPFLICKRLRLSVKLVDKKFYFIHGYEFEVLASFDFITIEEFENLCQHLCEIRDTTIGKIESYFWSLVHFQVKNRNIGKHFTIPQSIINPPEHRFKELHSPSNSVQEIVRPFMPRNKIEALSMSPLARSIFVGGKPEEVLIFGHTHSPFISENKMVANSGSWVTDNEFHNTYIKINDLGEINLCHYETS
jgi:UDP-2,3-diacylglucosamine pyrophosphatase LpxH